MLGIEKPLPMANQDSEPYWEAADKGTLVVSKCGACNHVFLPPANLCPVCLAEDVSFTPASGRGKIYSFIVVHRPQHPAFFPDAPYNVAIVELEEGPRLHTRIVDADPNMLKVDAQVTVDFEKVDDEISLPVFRLTTT